MHDDTRNADPLVALRQLGTESSDDRGDGGGEDVGEGDVRGVAYRVLAGDLEEGGEEGFVYTDGQLRSRLGRTVLTAELRGKVTESEDRAPKDRRVAQETGW